MPTLQAVVALMACRAPVFSAAAQTISHTSVKPQSAQNHKAAMRHSLRATGSISRPRSTILLWACSGG